MTALERAKQWLTDAFDEETRAQVQKLINENSAELEDSFYKTLEFGTGGMRGIMGVGTNRLNRYTLGQLLKDLPITSRSSSLVRRLRLLWRLMFEIILQNSEKSLPMSLRQTALKSSSSRSTALRLSFHLR